MLKIVFKTKEYKKHEEAKNDCIQKKILISYTVHDIKLQSFIGNFSMNLCEQNSSPKISACTCAQYFSAIKGTSFRTFVMTGLEILFNVALDVGQEQDIVCKIADHSLNPFSRIIIVFVNNDQKLKRDNAF
jgi:hypothetical protein